MDFFTVEVVSLVGLVRYHVLFVIDLASRRVELAGLVHETHEVWMKQVARNLTDRVDGFLLGKRYVIMDRDPLFTDAFRTMLATLGAKSVRLPARSPNLNTFAERFVRSVRDECLSKVIPLGERHLREVLREYVARYHGERHHQGLANRLIDPTNNDSGATGRVVRRKRLGGILSFYQREAAMIERWYTTPSAARLKVRVSLIVPGCLLHMRYRPAPPRALAPRFTRCATRRVRIALRGGEPRNRHHCM